MTQQPRFSDLSTFKPVDEDVPIEDLDSAERRTRRARTDPMIVVPEATSEGACTGIYHVVSGSGETYPIVLDQSGACPCSDTIYNQPERGCKHRRRVAISITDTGLPAPGDDVTEYMTSLAVAYEKEADFVGPLPESHYALFEQLDSTDSATPDLMTHVDQPLPTSTK